MLRPAKTLAGATAQQPSGIQKSGIQKFYFIPRLNFDILYAFVQFSTSLDKQTTNNHGKLSRFKPNHE
jgi:hypothetical protein